MYFDYLILIFTIYAKCISHILSMYLALKI